ncbi:MAG: aminotransferase class V-fold PLP-dependent enzyme [Planctomycetes bacterium]|nr:aminotransferase class V-fold PLP-dependent enzyme [Planctomycetota bacterium]
MDLPSPSPLAAHWDLDPAVVFLNHGSYGACPRVVLEEQARLRARIEAEPVRFFVEDIERELDAVRVRLGEFLGADPEDLAFVTNATGGVNTVLRSLDLGPTDELLVTDHEYNACRNALDFVAARSGAAVVVAHVPFPLSDPEEVVEALLAKVTDRTRLALVDHITSATGAVMPIEAIVSRLNERGVDTLVDGAHCPGQLDLNLDELGAAYYSGNCHKWLCTPKGSAVIHVRRDRQDKIRPLSISHGANSPRRDRSRFRLEADWTGTQDPTPILCIPAAIDAMGALYPGGWSELREKNRALALAGRATILSALGQETPCPDEMISHLATVILPEDTTPHEGLYEDPLQEALIAEHSVQVPVMRWAPLHARYLRISAQAYNSIEQYEHLAKALTALGVGA